MQKADLIETSFNNEFTSKASSMEHRKEINTWNSNCLAAPHLSHGGISPDCGMWLSVTHRGLPPLLYLNTWNARWKYLQSSRINILSGYINITGQAEDVKLCFRLLNCTL
jgi:hypothetical protein